LDGGDIGFTGRRQEIAGFRHDGSPFQTNLGGPILDGRCFALFVGGDPRDDFSLTFRLSNMFDADMNAFFNNTSIDFFIDTDTDGTLGDIENDPRATMVTLVGHPFVNGRIGKDIDIITDFHFHEILTQMNRSMLPMFLGEHMPCPGTDTKGMRHLGIGVFIE